MSSELVLAVMFASLVGLLLTGVPLAFTLGALALVFTLALWGPAALTVTVLNLYATMTSEALLAIPLYVMMASVLQRSGVIESLYKAMELWSRRLPGGLAVGTIAICTIIAAMTGIVGAAVDVGSGAAYDYPSILSVELGDHKTPPDERAAAEPTAAISRKP